MNIELIILILMAPSAVIMLVSVFVYYRDKIKSRSDANVTPSVPKSVTIEVLKGELEKALNKENYEKASELRNRIRKLESK
jgi:protein-arginine kinase activator protein McsA